jgi:hypothetical protein
LSIVVVALICAAWFAPPAFADSIPPKVDTTTPWGVNAADAQFRLDVTDLSIGPMTLERFTQSPSEHWPDLTPFGMLMTSNFDIYVMSTYIKATGSPYYTPQHYHVQVHLGNSAVGTYWMDYPFDSGAIRSDNVDSQAGMLTRSGATLVFTDRDGNVYTFNPSVSAAPTITGVNYGIHGPSQRVDHINFIDGRVRQFSYDASQRLKLVTDSTGYAILFDYGANGMVAAACGIDRAVSYVTATSTCAGQPLRVTYQYGTIDTQHAQTVPTLTGFTDVLGQTTTYTPGLQWGSPVVACIKPPGATTCKSQLTADENGFHQILADGSTWTFATESDPRIINDPDYVNGLPQFPAWVFDPAGRTTSYIFYLSAPLSISDANGNTTNYKWCCSQLEEVDAPSTLDGTLLTEVDYPEGNKYLAAYGGPANRISEERWVAKPGSGLPDRTVSYGYTIGYSEPTSKTDANHNVTNWTYTSFQAVESEMQPAPSAGAARPLKRYTYAQKTAWIKNSGGTLVSTNQPIWLPSTETLCQTVAGSNSPVCDSAAPQTVTTYQYGADGTADNLLLHGKAVSSGGTTLRTCYGYDAYSRKISETAPNANLATCP